MTETVAPPSEKTTAIAQERPSPRTVPMIFDADVHPTLDHKKIGRLLPQPWRRRYEDGNRGPGYPGYWNPNGVQRRDSFQDGRNMASRPEWIAEEVFDTYGISYAMLNDNPAATLSGELDFGCAVASATNDHLIQDWLDRDNRLRAGLVVHCFEPTRAAAEIRRVGAHPGFAQVLLPSATPVALGHRMYEPMYEAAAEMGLPVAIHPGNSGVGVAGPPTTFGYPSNYFEWRGGTSTQYIFQLCSLVAEGVSQKFPTLRFVAIEGGFAWLPALMWKLDKEWKALRQLTPWLDRPPSEVITEHVKLTTQPLEEPPRREQFWHLLDMFDSEHMLLFSTDYPHWDGDTPDFTGSALPKRMRPRVMSANACELYGIPK